ncbi:MAG: Holliday junction branch migration protein RuvA [Rhodobacter sp.]|uniref:Holliday junction branch migration protein RuvA n=1 Tax=Pararhodobacter sp. TaxID=2127056 RepID=UPI001DF2AA47|nr:Holliday junction branch migration protein RuvA [Pararhodobacter sp.]MCB1346803.1 Holliday junction branch migration protein RuvA [Paracoccaceae bacterium]MCC0071726.1 Holliday junction branch migration protein RuvA [Rhodobacter sp.]HPD93710.1 Holliday junction branch migration protein RuvA [Pararhodobacter sp.]
MIGKLSGRIDYRATDHVLLDVKGVGYIVHVSERTLMALPGPGGMAALYTELLVREDLLQLFGFLTLAEKEWHRLLMSVQGVGAKAAMAILGTLGPEGVSRAIAIGDAGAVRKAPGVGPKLAQRVVLELKDKAPTVMAMGAAAADLTPEGAVIETVPSGAGAAPIAAVADAGAAPSGPRAEARRQAQQAQADALSALTNLGYGPSEAAQAVATAAEDHGETPALIRAALKLLAPKS